MMPLLSYIGRQPSLLHWLEQSGFFERPVCDNGTSISIAINRKQVGMHYLRRGDWAKGKKYIDQEVEAILRSKKVKDAGMEGPEKLNAAREGTRQVFWLGSLEAQRSIHYEVPILVWKRYYKDPGQRRFDALKMRTMVELVDELYYGGLPVAPVVGLPPGSPEEVLALYLGKNLMEAPSQYTRSSGELFDDLIQRTADLAEATLSLTDVRGADESLERLRPAVGALCDLGGLDRELQDVCSTLWADERWPLIDPSWRNWVVSNGEPIHVDQDRFSLGASRHYNFAHAIYHPYEGLEHTDLLDRLAKTQDIDERIFDASLYYLLTRVGRARLFGLPATFAVSKAREEAQHALEEDALGWLVRQEDIAKRYPRLASKLARVF